MQLPPNSPDLETAVDRLHRIYADYEQKILADIDALATSGFSDKRMCAIARTDFEKAFMVLHRALRDYPGDDPNQYGKTPHHEPLPDSFVPPPDAKGHHMVGPQGQKIEWQNLNDDLSGPDSKSG